MLKAPLLHLPLAGELQPSLSEGVAINMQEIIRRQWPQPLIPGRMDLKLHALLSAGFSCPSVIHIRCQTIRPQ